MYSLNFFEKLILISLVFSLEIIFLTLPVKWICPDIKWPPISVEAVIDLARCYVDAIKDKDLDFDCIYGPAYKGIFLGSIVATLFSEQGNNYPLSFNRKEEKDHGEGGNIIGAKPTGNVLIIDDVLSAGTAGRESIETILNLGATPNCFIVGLDRQEKGNSDLSSSSELSAEFNIKVESIVNLDDLISFVTNDSKYFEFFSNLNNYREKWGA